MTMRWRWWMTRGAAMLLVASVLGAPAAAQCVRLVPGFEALDDGAALGLSVDVAGDRAVVGAHLSPPGGQAFVLEYDGAAWSITATLTASDRAAGDGFGAAVAISADGATIAVGAFGADGATADEGAAYVFRDVGGAWTEVARLAASDAGSGDGLGLALDTDGARVIAAADRHDVPIGNGGALYVFRDDGAAWTEEAKLVAPDAAGGDRLGREVLIDDDLLVGTSIFHDALGANSGAAYLWRRIGTTWTFEQKLLASDGAALAWFGHGLARAASGELFFGAQRAESGGAERGAVYVFRDDAPWTEVQRIDPAPGADGMRFGRGIAVHDDTLYVGASAADDTSVDGGRVDVFVRRGAQWAPSAVLVAPAHEPGARFGLGVGAHPDAPLIGAYLGHGAAGPESGALFAATLDGTDCDGNGSCDDEDLATGRASDCDENGQLDVCDGICPFDLSHNCAVDVGDVLLLIAMWGETGPADFDGDRLVGFSDLLVLLSSWGTTCP